MRWKITTAWANQRLTNQLPVYAIFCEKIRSDDNNHKMLTKYLKLPVSNKLYLSIRHFIMITTEERDLL